MTHILSLDVSTSCTGYAFFKINGRELVDYGIIKSTTKGTAKMGYPEKQLNVMMKMAEDILTLIRNLKPDAIVIEEIAGSKNRLGQKTLDGMHYILAYYLNGNFPFEKVFYMDVTGSRGWRDTYLQLRLSDADKLSNKEARKLNKILPSAQQIPVIGPKHLSCRHANRTFGIDLNVDLRKTDADMADAISMGDAFLRYRYTEL